MSVDLLKTDAKLGQEINEYLEMLNIQTPMVSRAASISQNTNEVKELFRTIMTKLNLDLTDDSLSDTPKRVAKLYCNEIFYGLSNETFPKCTLIDNKFNVNMMVVERNIPVYSFCEHHFLPIVGKATVGYIPNDKIIGLSKLNRITEYFAKRPQVQERMTEQIHAALSYVLKTEHVAVLVEAKHMCVEARGVSNSGCSTVTSKLSGSFKNCSEVRSEFMSLRG